MTTRWNPRSERRCCDETGEIVRDAATVADGQRLEIQLAASRLNAQANKL